MREIKFRAWDTEEFYMAKKVQSMYDGYCKDDDTLNRYGYCGSFNSFIGDDRFVLMQYTGFKDMNGKEIYEGDIIDTRYAKNHKHRYLEIKYLNGAFIVNDEFSKHTLDLYLLEKIPVVGNIYENPELLDGEV